MRGSLETIVGAMFAGKTSELLKRILWAKHQNKKIVVIKPSLDNRYSESKIITHNELSHECFAMQNWSDVNKEYNFKKRKISHERKPFKTQKICSKSVPSTFESLF